ncbi:hypothetical protein QWY31_05080 [Cytophagales bacterium LB-30]|uniref:DUF1792 domain-containing protein n=1 Tax=Shiella aurantiaca TaxID=3058365 RepID=A0ABT8F332_9BACT|nr:hypothetical protein [Shiella aurantiaca]MDN4164863.1 hypothetical protein [Shiella aurantiaca]
MIQTRSTLETYHRVSNLFAGNKRAFYSRFGDGDVFIMMGKDQQNHKASPALTQELIEAFDIKHPAYLKGLSINYPNEKGMSNGLFARFSTNQMMADFIESRFGIPENYQFENPVFLHYLAVFNPKLANTFLNDHVRNKKKMYIGTIPKEQAERLLGKIDYHIATPARDSYYTIDEWWPKVLENIHQVELVIPATGMATRVINKRLWEMDIPLQSIDIGSIVDVLDGRNTRKWIRLAGHRIDNVLLDKSVKTLSRRAWYWYKEAFYQIRLLIKG